MEIGIDATSISRFKDVGKHFIKRILTEIEYEEYKKLNDEEKKATFLATHWAVKEAIFKASQDLNFLTYTLKHTYNGKPYILEHDELKISITHENDLVIAIVLKLS